jgi:hypothetical protein
VKVGLQLSPADTQELQLICKCCRQPYYPNHAWESSWDAVVLGAEKFAICPICGQKVSQEQFESYRYRERWLRAVKKRLPTATQ